MHNGLLNFFKRFRRDEFEEFFKELFPELKPVEYLNHPADETLRAYLAGRLSNRWRLDDPQILERLKLGKLEDWQRSEVSAHLMTCLPCAKKLSEWRAAAEAVKRPKGAQKPRLALRWGFKLGALATIVSLLLLLWPRDKPTPSYGQPKAPDYESAGGVGGS